MVVKFMSGNIPVRFTIWVMIFTCVWLFYMMRINLSIILLAMVEPSRNADNSTVIPECKKASQDFPTSNISVDYQEVPNFRERYRWDTKLQGVILGAYFYGFILTGLPAGYLTERYGPRRCILASFTLSGLLTIVGPWAAHLHYWVLIASRFVIGAIGGVVYPCMYYLIARYAPLDEKGKFVGALMGNSLGTIVTWPLLGAIIEKYGWSWAFYACGIIVLAWVMLFMVLVYDAPEDHPFMSEAEKRYIIESLSKDVKKKIEEVPPYKDIAKSLPFWALLILHFGNLWGLFFLLTAGPNFMSTVLGFTLGHTGLLAALPYLARAVFGFIFGALGDIIIRRELMSRTRTRKVFVLFSHILPGVLLLIQTLVGCNISWSIVLITMSLGMNGASTLTNLQNPQDLSPNFAPTIYGTINSIGSTTGFINPLIVGYMTAEHNGLEEWHSIFYIGSSVYIACGLVFCIFGSGETQLWNGMNLGEEKDGFDVDSLEMKDESDGGIIQFKS